MMGLAQALAPFTNAVGSNQHLWKRSFSGEELPILRPETVWTRLPAAETAWGPPKPGWYRVFVQAMHIAAMPGGPAGGRLPV